MMNVFANVSEIFNLLPLTWGFGRYSTSQQGRYR